jgi:DNA-directed RNA polymerase specialized sigma24 family protein
MIDRGSVTLWLDRLTAGDPEALGPLWGRYYDRVVSLARTRLRRLDVRAAADEEDVATSAFHQFYRAAVEDRFARLENRDDLWQVLTVLTARKVVDYHKYEGRWKRRGSVELPNEVPSTTADPAAVTLAADEVRALFERLPNDEVREIARLKLDGYSSDEIADRLGCIVRTVNRRLALIRSIWDNACP